ncbi:DUF2975 domain-containing protein [Erythrobacter sp. AP23]|uniref:DUF2975 domain-containing protein n=1 Tax=Erythrobacter sp. AP23 TaxID=499656 RepID=UPI00076C7671|nr:DUF2975 domain-containing protein [Erythrobacter sp. AP23]KWV93921.1 hypothetical protein ASS64_13615 [Erythrobacter sp. AP23]
MPELTRPNDLLLLAGKVLAVLAQATMAIAAVALALAGGTAIANRDKISIDYAEALGDPAAIFPLSTLLGAVALALVIVAALLVFFDQLRRIIATAGRGDPFAPINADRLGRMAWLMLLVQVLLHPTWAMAERFSRIAQGLDTLRVGIGSGIDIGGILLVVILFLLARIFRHGTSMREDLEGTV